jgi:hypothetical protein
VSVGLTTSGNQVIGQGQMPSEPVHQPTTANDQMAKKEASKPGESEDPTLRELNRRASRKESSAHHHTHDELLGPADGDKVDVDAETPQEKNNESRAASVSQRCRSIKSKGHHTNLSSDKAQDNVDAAKQDNIAALALGGMKNFGIF